MTRGGQPLATMPVAPLTRTRVVPCLPGSGNLAKRQQAPAHLMLSAMVRSFTPFSGCWGGSCPWGRSLARPDQPVALSVEGRVPKRASAKGAMPDRG